MSLKLVILALLGPLLVPSTLFLIGRAVALLSEEPVPPGPLLSVVVAPAVPLYLMSLPLLPVALLALRRGWIPSLLGLLGALIGAGLLLDLAFVLASR